MDHVVPLSKGGKWVWENLVTACSKCNGKKGSKSLKQLGWTLKQRPKARCAASRHSLHTLLWRMLMTPQRVISAVSAHVYNWWEAQKPLQTLRPCRSLHPTSWVSF